MPIPTIAAMNNAIGFAIMNVNKPTSAPFKIPIAPTATIFMPPARADIATFPIIPKILKFMAIAAMPFIAIKPAIANLIEPMTAMNEAKNGAIATRPTNAPVRTTNAFVRKGFFSAKSAIPATTGAKPFIKSVSTGSTTDPITMPRSFRLFLKIF